MDWTEKRKNDAPPRFQWWLLLIGFALGVVVTLLVVAALPPPPNANVQAGPAPSAFTPQYELDNFFLTATAIIIQATEQAATPLP
jgi:hypothetical protein